MRSCTLFFLIGLFVAIRLFLSSPFVHFSLLISFLILAALLIGVGGAFAFDILPKYCRISKCSQIPKNAITKCLAILFPLLLALILGFAWGTFSIHSRLSHWLPKNLEGKTLVAQGVIASIPQQKNRSVRFLFKINRLQNNPHVVSLPMKVRLSWYGHFPRLKVGDKWALSVRLKRPHGFHNPAGFNYENWLMEQGVGATGYVYGKGKNSLLASDHWSYPISRIREFLAASIRSTLVDNKMSGLIVALSVGDRSGISQQQWQIFRATGTSHLMAISGLHIGLVAGFFYVVINFLWRRVGTLALWLAAPEAGAIAALVGGLLYSAMAGFSLPTQRALIMIAVAMIALLFRRELKPFNALSIALIIILVLDPLAILSSGFWLSFGAVSVIIYGVSSRLKIKSLWWRVGRVQWVVTMGLLPLTLLFFQQASLGGLGANVVAIPWVGFVVVPLTLAGTLLVAISPYSAAILLKLAAMSLNWLWLLLTKLGNLPHFVWYHTLSNPLVFIAAVIGILLLIAPRGLPARWLGILWLVPLFLIKPARPENGTVWLTLLDVGQGLSAVIQTHNHTLVYDTGPRFSESFNAGDAVLIPFLRYRGVSKIDTLVISHGDSDHIGGAHPLLKSIPADLVLTSVPDRFPHQHTKLCRKGQHWEWDGITFKMLFPVPAFMNKNNNKSCVLAIRAGNNQILLTGDIEAPAERYLVRHERSELKSTILIAPHHGSITSSTVPFVNAVDPKYVLFPVGYRNRFHFPSQVVLDRYRRVGAQVFRTDGGGAVGFLVSGLSALVRGEEVTSFHSVGVLVPEKSSEDRGELGDGLNVGNSVISNDFSSDNGI